MKGMVRTDKRNKLNTRYIGPFEMLNKIGPVAYCLALPPKLERNHNVFYVSQLRKYIPDPNHIIPYQSLQVREDISFVEEPIQFLDHKEKQLRN